MIWILLWRLIRINLASSVVYPSAIILERFWARSWRFALMESYLEHWRPDLRSVEGASQRIQEDTKRFTLGLVRQLVRLFDSVVIISTFLPVLNELGGRVPPPGFGVGEAPAMWLPVVTVAVCILGLSLAIIIGSKLVDLEVENQKTEAKYRSLLVLIESAYDTGSKLMFATSEWKQPVRQRVNTVVSELYKNYTVLYRHFGYLEVFMLSWRQNQSILPCEPQIGNSFRHAHMDDRVHTLAPCQTHHSTCHQL